MRCLLLCAVARTAAWAPAPAARVAALGAPPLWHSRQCARCDGPRSDLLIDNLDDADTCLLPIYFEEDTLASKAKPDLERFQVLLTALPIVLPLLAFATYDNIVVFFHSALSFTRTWYSVDGGASEAALITPVINGVVQPAVSIVLGTLVASTLNALRNRQISIRASLNKEASDIRLLDASINTMYPAATAEDAEYRRTYLGALRQYVSRLLVESSVAQRGSPVLSKTSESELDGIMRGIFAERVGSADAADGMLASRGLTTNYDPVRFALPGLIQGMNHRRSQRLAELQTSYPTVYWAILTLLSTSIVVDFLIESDQAALQFLESFQLRLLFTILIGVFSATFSLCVDLNDPFRGNFRITASADQLYVIRETLSEEMLASCELAPPVEDTQAEETRRGVVAPAPAPAPASRATDAQRPPGG